MRRGDLIFALLFIMLAPVILSTAAQGAAPGKARPKWPRTLIWTYTDFAELRANAKTWHDRKGIDGFIFCMVTGGGPPRWDSGPQKIREIYAELPQTVAALRKARIDANFVHAGIDSPTWDWFDDERLAKLPKTFAALAKVAKAAGCRRMPRCGYRHRAL